MRKVNGSKMAKRIAIVSIAAIAAFSAIGTLYTGTTYAVSYTEENGVTTKTTTKTDRSIHGIEVETISEIIDGDELELLSNPDAFDNAEAFMDLEGFVDYGYRCV